MMPRELHHLYYQELLNDNKEELIKNLIIDYLIENDEKITLEQLQDIFDNNEDIDSLIELDYCYE